MLVALASVIAPGTSNCVHLKYLKFLMRPDAIQSYDWASVCFKCIGVTVLKFQDYVKSGTKSKRGWNWYGSCLPLLLVWIYYFFFKIHIGIMFVQYFHLVFFFI
jgi:hypothetical protein